MPRYYTPKRPAVRFANSGSAMQPVSVQRVEPVVEVISDKATQGIDFSGVPRIPRPAPPLISAGGVDLSHALHQPLAFQLASTSGSLASFVRYSWLPRTSYLQAEQMGIYNFTGAVQALATNPASQKEISSQSGSVVLETPAAFVNTWNVYASGVEDIDSQVSRSLYWSKTSVSGASSLTIHDIWKFVPGIDDLVGRPPPTSPSRSALLAPQLSGGGATSAYKQRIGTVSSFDTGTIVVTDWQTYITSSATASMQSAFSGNLVYVGSVTASVVDISLTGSGNSTASIFVSLSTSAIPTATAIYLHSWVPLSDGISGTYVNANIFAPYSFPVIVGRTGRLRDIRAWVEFIHDYRSVSQYTASGDIDDWGLQGIQVALRSPNTSFYSAHPIWNGSPNLPLRTNVSLTGTGGVLGSFYYGVPEILRNSYLLWQGHGADFGLLDTLSASATGVDNFYHEFDRDIDLRAVFWDGSPTANPRDLLALYPSAVYNALGPVSNSYGFLTASVSSGLYPSPTAGAILAGLAPFAAPPLTHSLSCSDVPWMLDTRLDLGSLNNAAARTQIAISISPLPPAGWLSSLNGALPWTAVSSTGAVKSSDIGPSGRAFVRPLSDTADTAGFVYAMGGNNSIGGGTEISGVWYTPYTVNPSLGTFAVSGAMIKSVIDLPAALDSFSVTYFRVSTGSAATSSFSKERVLLIGGINSSATLSATSSVYVGYWISSSNDITWQQTTALPSGVTGHDAFVFDGKVYVSPGLKSIPAGVEVKSSATYITTVDQQTGQPGSWTEVIFPTDPLVQTTKFVVVSADTLDTAGGATSSDGAAFYPISQSMMPSGNSYMGIASDGGENFVAVTANGKYFKSTDFGATWSSGTILSGASAFHFVDVCWCTGSGKWIAVGHSICTSSNGTSWSEVLPSAALGGELGYVPVTSVLPSTLEFPIQYYTNVPFRSTNLEQLTGSGANPFSASGKVVTLTSEFTGANNVIPVPVTVSLYYQTSVSGTSEIHYVTSLSSAIAGASSGITINWNFNWTAPNLDDVTLWVSATMGPVSGYYGSVRFKMWDMYAREPGVKLYAVAAAGASGSPNWVQAVGVGENSPYHLGDRGTWYSIDGGATWAHARVGQNVTGSYIVPEDGAGWFDLTWVPFSASFVASAVGLAGSGSGFAYLSKSVTSRYDTSNGHAAPPGDTGITWGSPSGSGIYGRLVIVKSPAGPSTAGYSDDYGQTWTNISLPAGSRMYDVIWSGVRYVGAGNNALAAYSAYSDNGISWSTNNAAPYRRVAVGSGTAVLGVGLPKHSFFDVVADATGTARAFMWTTHYTSSVGLTTVRSELLPASATAPANDAGIQNVGNSSLGSFRTAVDDIHRAWGIDGILYSTRGFSYVSQITWDPNNNRPNMSIPQPNGYVDPYHPTANPGGVTAFLSGVLVVGLPYSNDWSTNLAVTYLHGPSPAQDEFNTLGHQVGPSTIRPVYPLLDDVYALKLTDQTPGISGAFALASNRPQLIGYRPGLRGTESSGAWNFLFGAAATHSFSPTEGYSPSAAGAIWVRQMRIETIVDANQPLFFQNPARARLYSRPVLVPSPTGQRLNSIQSGSAAWDIGLLSIQTRQDPDYGRTISITTDLNAFPDTYAVLTFITGNLYAKLSASGVVGPTVFQPSWFLGGNGFGTPFIPDSSMSLGTGSAEQIDQAAAQEVLDQTVNIQTLVPGANDLPAYQSRQGYTKTTLVRWEETVAAQSSGSSSVSLSSTVR